MRVARLIIGARLGTTVALLATLYAAAGAAAEVTTLEPQGGVGVERGVVVVRCSTERPNVWRISRGALLDLNLLDADRDVVLTTAHGLPAGSKALRRDCRVLGEHGRPYRIEDAWRATDDESDVARDWAVLLLRRRLGGGVGRLRVGQMAPETVLRLTDDEAPVRLLLRHADVRQGDCHLRPVGDATLDPRLAALIFYSCQRAAGLSGSPILAGIGGRSLLIGIHVGWTLAPVEGGLLRSVSVGRPIDARIAAAIAAATVRARR